MWTDSSPLCWRALMANSYETKHVLDGPWLHETALTKLAAHSEVDAKGGMWAISLFCKHTNVASVPAVRQAHQLD